MKRKLTFFSLTLMILLLGSMQTPAQFSDTLSENLTQTTYGWEVTIATGNTGDISEGDTIDYILDEAPAGMDWYEYLEIGVVVKAN
ncbi:MAG: hypothetical protein ACXAE3_14170, partial [Candidatus Kariarchaeaceae archaeon]